MAVPDTRRSLPQGKRLDDDALSRIARMRAKPTVDDSLSVQPTTEGRARAEAERLEAARRATAERDARQQPGTVYGKEDKGTPAVPKPPKAEGEDDLSYLAKLRAQQEKERQAQAGEREASKAQQVQSTRAKAGAAGLGLSGASAGQEATVIRQADRSNALSEAALEQRFRDEEFDGLGRQGAIMDYEDVYDTDMDGDGLINGRPVDERNGIGDGNPDNDPDDEDEFKSPENLKAELKAKNNEELDSWDHSTFDENAEPGDIEEPYVVKGDIRDLYNRLRGTGALPLEQVTVGRGIPGRDLTLFVDQYGNYYWLDRS